MGSESAVVDLQALQDELAQRAAKEHSGRAARTLPNPVDGLRQTVIALRAGTQLGEHDSPGPASLLVLRGRVRLVAGDEVIEMGPHELSPVPDRRHSLHADEDTVVLLSIAIRDRPPLLD
jgi:quercetin dioxygenase-like cupin family protein